MAKRRRSALKSAYGTEGLLKPKMPKTGIFNDLYYGLLTADRLVFGLVVLAFYLGINGLFALAYMTAGGVANARPGSFTDAFFFSVQTMATIGYGRLVPESLLANSLVTIEAGLGLFGIAVAASLMYARFTRATAGVRFSKNAVITRFEGKPTLMIRLANERVVRINEAHIYLVVARQQVTLEGQSYRRLFDLEPLRSFSPVFELSWTVMHVIDEQSPLWGCTPASLASSDTSVAVVFSGHHEGFQQRVHARHNYASGDLLWDHRFADLFRRDAAGAVTLDFTQFDAVLPVPEADRL
jgi:inward rectifier potassium channel